MSLQLASAMTDPICQTFKFKRVHFEVQAGERRTTYDSHESLAGFRSLALLLLRPNNDDETEKKFSLTAGMDWKYVVAVGKFTLLM